MGTMSYQLLLRGDDMLETGIIAVDKGTKFSACKGSEARGEEHSVTGGAS